LQSAIARPRQVFTYKTDDLHQLAAAYCFSLVKNHPFIDGNKRTGFLAMYAFLHRNGLDLNVDEMEAALKIEELAAGSFTEAELCDWLRENAAAIE
jgi:death-on-curing protein